MSTRCACRLRRALLVGTALGFSILIFATAAPSEAWAGDECGDDIAGVVVCTASTGVGNPYPSGIDYVGDLGEDITVTLAPTVGIETTFGDGLTVIGSPGYDASIFTLSGSSIDAVDIGIYGYTVGSGMGDVYVLNEATISAGEAGILVAAHGDGTVINLADIVVTSDVGGLGIAVTATNGDSYLSNNADITVSVVDSVAFGIVQPAFPGRVELNNSGDISVTSTYGQAYGIEIPSSANEGVIITSVGDIEAFGYRRAFGIRALSYHGDGSVDISLTGDIDVESEARIAHGIYVRASNEVNLSMQGDITVASNGDEAWGIDAYAHFAHGQISIGVVGDITVSANAAGNTAYGIKVAASTVDIQVDGSISADGANAYGVLAWSGTGGATIEVDDVTVVAATGGAGIKVYSSSDITLIASDILAMGDNVQGVKLESEDGSGSIAAVSVSTAGDHAEGISAQVQDDLSISVVDNVTTVGDFSLGISAASLSGDVYVGADNVTTSGWISMGIMASTSDGDIQIDVSGVTTYGNDAVAIRADSGESGQVQISADSITTYGHWSHGILITGGDIGEETAATIGSINTYGDRAIGLVTLGSNSDVQITVDDITTAGTSSIGALVSSVNGDVYVGVNNVTTAGRHARGVIAESFSGDASVSATGLVSTEGDFSIGIAAVTHLGTASVFSSGTVATQGTYSSGLQTFTYWGTAYALNEGTVLTYGDHSYAILGENYYGAGEVEVVNTGVIGTTGEISHGIYARAYGVGGSATATNGGYVSTTGDNSSGIRVTAFQGAAEVNSANGEIVTFGYFARGIDAYGQSGVDLVSGSVTTTGDVAFGIVAVSRDGDVAVSSYSVNTSGAYAYGVTAYVRGSDGDVEVSSYSVNTGGEGAIGIYAYVNGGDAQVTSHSVITSGNGADGIVGLGRGDFEITSYSVSTGGDRADGIRVQSTDGDITIHAVEIITIGYASFGIAVGARDGDVTVVAGTVSTLGDGAAAISARSHLGDISIVSQSVLSEGSYVYAIDARSDWGDVAVYSGSVVATGDHVFGIYAAAHGGEALIHADNVRVTGVGSSAVYAYAGNNGGGLEDAVIVVSGDIYSASGTGIIAGSNQLATVTVGSDATVFGGRAGIRTGTTATDRSFILNGGKVSAGSGLAIRVTGGAATIRNFEGGEIFGFVELREQDDSFQNEGLWEAFGTSRFNYGADTVANDGALGFSRFQGDASTTTLMGLEVFSNTGVVSGVDGQAGDTLALPGSVFNGSGGSTLALDVQLGGPGSTADRLTVGSAAGVTTIQPNDLLVGSPGVLNLGGILVVDSANASEVGDEFAMTAIDKGFVEYSLTFDPMTDNWLIVGLPSDAAFQMVAVARSAQDFSAHAGSAVTARWQESRDAAGAGSALSAGPGGSLASRSDGLELWMQGHGGDEGLADRQSFTVGGFTFDENLSHNTDWRGLQFGIDNRVGDSLWGVTMGFAQQETRFDTGDLSLDIEGWNVGGYFGWVAKNVFVNALVKGDFFEVDANLTSVAAAVSFEGATWGAQGEAGLRLGDQAASWFVEPVTALAWSSTQMDRASALGATIDFGDANSLVGKAGVRFGQTFETDKLVLTPVVGVFAVNEFQGDNQMTFATGPDSFFISDTPPGTYGQMEFGLTTETRFGLQGFLKGEWNFGDQADGGGVRMGLSWRW